MLIVCILDDPLSACDAHVGKALFFDCIIDALKCRGKGIVLATHQLQYLQYADKTVVLDGSGRQVFYGSYAELLDRREEFPFLDMSKESATSDPSTATSVLSRAGSTYDGTRRSSLISQRATEDLQSLASGRQHSMRAVQVEDRVEGGMQYQTILAYLRSGGIARGLIALFMAFLSQGLLMIAEYWLRWWTSESFGPQTANMYVIVFAVLTVLRVVMGFTRARAWFRFTLGASSHLHETSLWAVMHSPLQFFIANPTGRILNRFSRDQNQADELLPVTLFEFLSCVMFCLGGVVLVCVSLPYMIALLPFLYFAFLNVQKKYSASAREIKRIDAITRSPIYSDFSASLDGLVTLRAYRLREKFTSLFQDQIDSNGRAFFSFLMISRWFGFRLDLLSTLLLIGVTMLAAGIRDQVDVGLIGFALTYTFSLSGLFQWTVRQGAEVETQLTSIERISAYAHLPAEPGYKTSLASFRVSQGDRGDDAAQLETRPVKGTIELKNLSVTYREDLPPVLKQLNATFPAGAKVGVCGRTGRFATNLFFSFAEIITTC